MKKFIQTTSLFIATLAFVTPISSFAAAPQTQTCQNPVHINSWRGCEPVVTTVGTVSTDSYSAIVEAYYSSRNADYNVPEDQPSLWIEYGRNNGDFMNSSKSVPQAKGNRNTSFLLEGLDEGVMYKYRAALNWVGGVKYGEVKYFTAQKQLTGSSTTTGGVDGTTAGSTATNNTASSVDLDYSTPTPASSVKTIFGGLFGGKKKATSNFKNVDEKSGFKLTIDDGNSTVKQGDEVTLKVRYENNNAKAYTNAKVAIYVPQQYTFKNSNKGVYDRINQVLVVDLKDFPAGAFGTAVVVADATGKSGDFDQAVAQASLQVAGLTLSVADIDEYAAGKTSVLGASASGGFLPGSLIGWVILLVVIAIIVIVARRYFLKKDY